MTNLLTPLEASDIQEDEHFTAVAQQAQIAATHSAFAVWCVGGDRIVTWGHPDVGGNSSAIQNRLRDVREVKATGSAFAAVLANRHVVTWGDSDYGGDSSGVQDQLRDVGEVQARRGGAFAAILTDGRVVTWGHPRWGGDSSAVQDQLWYL